MTATRSPRPSPGSAAPPGRRGARPRRLLAALAGLTVLAAVAVGALPGPRPAAAATVEIVAASSSDDAEESASGSVSLSSSDLELVTDSSVQQVGVRFPSVPVPPGADVLGAHLQFTVDEATSGATTLVVSANAVDSAAPFAKTTGDVSRRPDTAATVTWSPPAWPTVGQAGPDQRSPDVSALVREVVARPGWRAGNALAFTLTGSGKRVAEAVDSGSGAPRLVLQVADGEPVPPPPTDPVPPPPTDPSPPPPGEPAPGLPGSITGVMPEAHGHLGPVRDSRGALYTVVEDFLAAGNRPMAMRSTDGGRTWGEVDRAGRPTTGDLEADWLVQSGTTAWFGWQKSSGTVYLSGFATGDSPTSPDRWTTPLQKVHSPSSKPRDQWVSLAALSTGEIWVLYSTEPASGQSHRVGLRSRSATGALGPQVLLDPARAVSQAVAVAGRGDVTHVFYKDHSRGQVLYRTVSRLGVLGSPVRVDVAGTDPVHSPLTNAVVHEDNGVERVTVAWADTARRLVAVTMTDGVPGAPQPLSDVPVAVNPGQTTNLGAVAHLVADGSTVRALYADAATQDIWSDAGVAGTSWGPDTLVARDLTVQWLTGLHVYPDGAGSRVLGFLYDTGPHGDDAGDIRYDERVLASAAP